MGYYKLVIAMLLIPFVVLLGSIIALGVYLIRESKRGG